ncbi:MAG: hypothetical protein P8Y47_06785 [Alphaproteobacteria bacterium]
MFASMLGQISAFSLAFVFRLTFGFVFALTLALEATSILALTKLFALVFACVPSLPDAALFCLTLGALFFFVAPFFAAVLFLFVAFASALRGVRDFSLTTAALAACKGLLIWDAFFLVELFLAMQALRLLPLLLCGGVD